MPKPIHLGCAGWGLPRDQWPAFPEQGTHLQRYAARFPAAEINSSFYRAHRPTTYAKWAQSVAAPFSFSVKLPKQITHELQLRDCDTALERFLAECTQLGDKLGCLLIQLPPSLSYEPKVAEGFFRRLRERYSGYAVLEPRHPSWLEADGLLVAERIGRVAADPSPIPAGNALAGWPGVRYFRLHGAPRMYYSAYDPAWLAQLADCLRAEQAEGRAVWCIFDNTASGAATRDALHLQRLLEES